MSLQYYCMDCSTPFALARKRQICRPSSQAMTSSSPERNSASSGRSQTRRGSAWPNRRVDRVDTARSERRAAMGEGYYFGVPLPNRRQYPYQSRRLDNCGPYSWLPDRRVAGHVLRQDIGYSRPANHRRGDASTRILSGRGTLRAIEAVGKTAEKEGRRYQEPLRNFLIHGNLPGRSTVHTVLLIS